MIKCILFSCILFFTPSLLFAQRQQLPSHFESDLAIYESFVQDVVQGKKELTTTSICFLDAVSKKPRVHIHLFLRPQSEEDRKALVESMYRLPEEERLKQTREIAKENGILAIVINDIEDDEEVPYSLWRKKRNWYKVWRLWKPEWKLLGNFKTHADLSEKDFETIIKKEFDITFREGSRLP